jgi:hypothetical protein
MIVAPMPPGAAPVNRSVAPLFVKSAQASPASHPPQQARDARHNLAQPESAGKTQTLNRPSAVGAALRSSPVNVRTTRCEIPDS